MKDFHIAQKLIGDSLTEDQLKYVDCYVHEFLGLFIPSIGPCGYAQRPMHTHPSYMFMIVFGSEDMEYVPPVPVKKDHYFSVAMSPGVCHSEDEDAWRNYYCILIDKEYFESQYSLYSDEKPFFNMMEFEMCKDILKALNTFAFEYSKQMNNAEITLNAQATIITHWIIRSLLGENYDMRAVSGEYVVARAQHYMELHFDQHITTDSLAKLGSCSVSTFNRKFKKETGITPIEYLIQTRIQKSMQLLRRKEIPITEIAFRCGFNSSAHFSSSFHRINNMTPKAYREAYVE